MVYEDRATTPSERGQARGRRSSRGTARKVWGVHFRGRPSEDMVRDVAGADRRVLRLFGFDVSIVRPNACGQEVA